MATDEVLAAWQRGIDARLQELDDQLRAAAFGGGAGKDDESFEPIFDHVGEWVEVYFAPTFIRRLSQTRLWCPSWWDHSEAYIRLDALWRSWEVHRVDAQRGMAVWFRDFLDGQLVTLFSDSGPFEECTKDEHQDRSPLPLNDAPEDWFTKGG